MKSEEKSRRGISRKTFLQASGAAVLGLGGLPRSTAAKSAHQESEPVSMEIKVQRLHLKHTWTIARNSSDYKDNVMVRLTRDGLSGWGEAAPNVRYGESTEKTVQRLESVRPLVEAFDWLHYSDLKSELDRAITDQSCAKAALDIAVLDWVGKKFSQPLFRIFGLDQAKTPVTTFSIGIDKPEIVREKVREAAAFPVLKIKVGTDSDAEMLKAVRSVTDKPLRVDANEGWKTKEQALERILWLNDQGVELIEQPLPSSMLEETKWLRDRVKIPIIADEAVKTAADIPVLASAYDGINIKLMKSGGVQEALTMIRMARALGLRIMLGCMIESSVAIAAAAHLSPLVDYADLDGNLLISDDPFSGLGIDQGRLVLSTYPGLGVTSVA
jgi:L-Ala-D/L-Glu epimerase